MFGAHCNVMMLTKFGADLFTSTVASPTGFGILCLSIVTFDDHEVGCEFTINVPQILNSRSEYKVI